VKDTVLGLLVICLVACRDHDNADALVQQLSGLPPAIDPGPGSWLCNPALTACSPPLLPAEAKRQRIYDQLFALGSAGLAALARALQSHDVSLRSNAALALGVLSGGSWITSDGAVSKIDISAALPALTIALRDPDIRTRGLAAQAVGDIGTDAAPAVPALIELLASDEEGLRNSACIGLRGIGPPARAALPALRIALADPSRDVRRFAESAIARIEGAPTQ